MITRRTDGVTTYQFAPLKNLNIDQRAMLEQAIADYSHLIIWGESVTWCQFGRMVANFSGAPNADLIVSLIEIMGGDR